MGRRPGDDVCGRRATGGGPDQPRVKRRMAVLAPLGLAVAVLAGCQGAAAPGSGDAAGGTDTPTIPGLASSQAAPPSGTASGATSAAAPGASPGATSGAAQAPAPSTAVPGLEVGGQELTVTGRIEKVQQQTATVRTPSGDVTVTWDAGTALLDTRAAKRSDLRTGRCVVAATAVVAPGEGGGRDGVDEVVWVLVSPALDDTCATAAPQAPGASGAARIVSGRVTAVKGADVTLSTVGVGRPTAQLHIALAPKVTVVQTASAKATAVRAGRCIVAVGARSTAGHVQAGSLTLSDRSGGDCAT